MEGLFENKNKEKEKRRTGEYIRKEGKIPFYSFQQGEILFTKLQKEIGRERFCSKCQ